jgi:small subunit ribosomal protein S1
MAMIPYSVNRVAGSACLDREQATLVMHVSRSSNVPRGSDGSARSPAKGSLQRAATRHLDTPSYMTSTTVSPVSPATAPVPSVAINDIGSADDFLAAIDKTIKYFNDGDIVEGTIVKVDRDEVLLDIGYKTEGVIPSRELSIKHDVDPNEVVSVGDEIEALVLQKEDKEGRLILSKKRAQYERAWGTIEQKKENDEVVEGTVIEVVKGGLIIDIGLRGFLPASLVEMRRVRDLQPYVGRTLEAKIIELDKNRNNVVLSRRAWLEQTQSEVRSEFLNKLVKGAVRTGVVSSIVNFGAFVDLGGVDGLVHVSELSWKHIDHPSEVVEVGQEVTVEVLDVDLDRERVSLSLKATQEDPWRQFARTHQIGQVVPGRVTKLVPFGAFVRVQDGIEGLVHISELAERHVEIPEQVVQVGDEILVKVIDIDLERRRISLSLKQANEGALTEESFDPAQYGMEAQYDDKGNYIYPDGFDPDTQEWLPGYEGQREAWEKRYAAARERFDAHRKQLADAQRADAEAATDAGEASSYSTQPADNNGTLATDEALAALREKLAGR